MFKIPENKYARLLIYALTFKNAQHQLRRVQCNHADEDHFCTALVAASGNPGTGTAFHEFRKEFWAFCKRNATSRNAIIHSRNTDK